MRARLFVPLCLLVVIAVAALFAQADVPQNMNVQGRLVDASGNPLGPQVFIYTFKIFDMEVGGTEIWPNGPGETQAVATDDNGVWNATVGDLIALPEAVFADTARWLEITVDNGVDPPETLTRTKLNMSPYGGRSGTSKLADNGVPIGSVIDWWRPNAGFPVPDGYAICDGSVLADPDSPFDGETLPDLRNQFVRGANTEGDIGTTGGSDAHDHTFATTTDAHTHDANPPATNSSPSGEHDHFANPPSTASTSVSLAHSHSTGSSGEHSSAISGTFDSNHGHVHSHNHSVSTSLGSHSHSTDIGTFSTTTNSNHTHATDIGTFSSSSVAAAVSGTTDGQGNVPAYTALLKIMKVK